MRCSLSISRMPSSSAWHPRSAARVEPGPEAMWKKRASISSALPSWKTTRLRHTSSPSSRSMTSVRMGIWKRARAACDFSGSSGECPCVRSTRWSVQVSMYMQYAAMERPQPMIPTRLSAMEGPSQSGQCQMLPPVEVLHPRDLGDDVLEPGAEQDAPRGHRAVVAQGDAEVVLLPLDPLARWRPPARRPRPAPAPSPCGAARTGGSRPAPGSRARPRSRRCAGRRRRTGRRGAGSAPARTPRRARRARPRRPPRRTLRAASASRSAGVSAARGSGRGARPGPGGAPWRRGTPVAMIPGPCFPVPLRR